MGGKVVRHFFQVYPAKRSRKFFFDCCVLETQRQMYDAYRMFCRAEKRECWPMNFRGCCACKHIIVVPPHGSNKRERLLPGSIGTIFLYRGKTDRGFGAETISHEMTHAAIHYWSLINKSPASRLAVFDSEGKDDLKEEAFCYIQGRLVGQFWEHYWTKINPQPKRKE